MSRRAGFTGSALVRWLASLGDLEVSESRQVFADRLSLWLGWTDAIALSAALDGSPAHAAAAARDAKHPPSAEVAECARVRSALFKLMTTENTRGNAARGDRDQALREKTMPRALDRSRVSGVAAGVAAGVSAEADAGNIKDFSPHRRRYVDRQQAMEAGIGPLRARLRTALAGRSPAMARLAAMDAVMEQLLGPREHQLLATVPTLLEKHFDRLAQHAASESAHDAACEPETPEAPGAWLDAFHRDMQGVLIAELDIRMQPIEGLLDALRS